MDANRLLQDDTEMHTLVHRLLDQNQQLIGMLGKALEGSSPVDIIRSLQGPVEATIAASTLQTYKDPYERDEGHPEPPGDPWGDEKLTDQRVIAGKIHGGFVDLPEITGEASEDGPAPAA